MPDINLLELRLGKCQKCREYVEKNVSAIRDGEAQLTDAQVTGLFLLVGNYHLDHARN